MVPPRTALGPRSRRRKVGRGFWRWIVVGAAGFVCLARMYVGAHLPLDVVGGAALGVAVGAIARLGFGRPRRDQ